MTWNKLTIGTISVKYTGIDDGKKEYPSCDENGNILTRVSGKIERGYFIDDKGNKFDKAFKLINGKPSKEFSGRIKDVSKDEFIEIEAEDGEREYQDLSIKQEWLVESQELYDKLTDEKGRKKAYKFLGWFGTGFDIKTCLVKPSEVKGFLILSGGYGEKINRIGEIVRDSTELKDKIKKLAEIDVIRQKVDRVKLSEVAVLRKAQA